MNETTKIRSILAPWEQGILSGKGIDIGSGPDPLPGAQKFDLQEGDANEITKYVHEQFDFVYSAHCLEHMHDPHAALREWWQLVRPGGHLFFIVPDEDLYEQGVWPSRFNEDHKATFTLSKVRSWSPVSVNVLQLVRSLPNSECIDIRLNDLGYDRSLLTFGVRRRKGVFLTMVFKIYNRVRRHLSLRSHLFEKFLLSYDAVDQTKDPGTFAQIQCVVKKVS